jgi:hypothetical protein
VSELHTQGVTAATLTRGQVMARGVVTAGALAAGGILIGGLPKLAVSQPSQAQDARVLDWLLQVEYLEAGFYAEAERRGKLNGELREFAALVGEQEPSFDFGDTVTEQRRFLATAVELEEMALAAFNGQVPNLTEKRLLMAMKVASVEARHVGWVRDLAGRNPAPRPADVPATQAQTEAAMKDTGFLE